MYLPRRNFHIGAVEMPERDKPVITGARNFCHVVRVPAHVPDLPRCKHVCEYTCTRMTFQKTACFAISYKDDLLKLSAFPFLEGVSQDERCRCVGTVSGRAVPILFLRPTASQVDLCGVDFLMLSPTCDRHSTRPKTHDLSLCRSKN